MSAANALLEPAGGAGNTREMLTTSEGIPYMEDTEGIRVVPYGAIADAVKAGKATSKGATGAIQITVNGKRMIYKPGPMGRVVNEYIAYQLYEAAGARVPRSYLVMNVNAEGVIPMAVLTEFLEGSLTVRQILDKGVPIPQTSNDIRRKTLKPGGGVEHMKWGRSLRAQKRAQRRTMKAEGKIGDVPLKFGEKTLLRNALKSEFIYHALFLNWDAKNADNHLVVPKKPSDENNASSESNGGWEFERNNSNTSSIEENKSEKIIYDVENPVTIDLGGSLYYRAMGEPKAKRFLLENEIQELVTIPSESAKTHLKLYAKYTNLATLKSNVCADSRKFPKEDDIMDAVENMRPLYKFLPKGADLKALISGRLAALDSFCREEYNIRTIKGQSRYAEHNYHNASTPPINFGVVTQNPKLMKMFSTAQTLLRKRIPIVKESLAEEAVAGLRMRGKRSVAADTEIPVTDEEMELVKMTEDWEPLEDRIGTSEEDTYPSPRFTILQDSTPLARSLRSKLVAMPEDPAIMEWLHQQVAYVEGLTKREYDILSSYTRNGDVLVNEYLRRRLVGDVSGLILAMINPLTDDRPIALGYSILDQYPELTRTGKLNVGPYTHREDLLELNSNTNSTLDLDFMRDLIRENMDFFGRAENILPLIEQYYKELREIIDKAPRAPHAFRVFRGIRSESHLSGLGFESVDFLSTTLVPDKTIRNFTNRVINDENLVSRIYYCCVYELDVSPSIPCIYTEPVSQYKGEYEILIAPGAAIRLEPTVHLKRFIDSDPTVVSPDLTKRQLGLHLQRPLGGAIVTVVEGTVNVAARKTKAHTVSGLLEGSLDDLAIAAATMVRPSNTAERFVSQKPRSQQVGKNRTRSNRWKNKRTATRKNIWLGLDEENRE